jgi:hypothetical protein
MQPRRPLELDRSLTMPSMGLLFVGERGKLMTGYSGGRAFGDRGLDGGLLLPEDQFQDVQQPATTLRRVPDHYGEWTRACKTGAPTVCPIDFGAEMTEMGLLGALALRTGRVLAWDANTMRVTNEDSANQWVDPPYRDGWSL